MKLLLTGDLHLRFKNPQSRKDNFFETQAEKVKFIFRTAIKNDCEAILQPGDFFDHARPSYYLVQYYIRLFKEYSKYNIPWYVIWGQHDMYLHSELAKDRTALKVMESAGLINFVDNKPFSLLAKRDERDDNVKLYDASYGQPIPEIKYKEKDDINILLIHKMILDKKLWHDQEHFDYANSFLRKYKDFDVILCGDYHYSFKHQDKKGRWILNGGCLVRKTTAKQDLEHQPLLHILDTSDMSVETIKVPIKPVEEVFNLNTQVESSSNEMLNKFVNSLNVNDGDFGFSFKENLDKFLEENDIKESVKNIIMESFDE